MIIILLCSQTCRSEAELDFEESLKQYVSIYKSKIPQNYSHCNVFYRATSTVSMDIVNWFIYENKCPTIIINKIFDFRSVVVHSEADFHFFESVDQVKESIKRLPASFFWNGKGDAHFIINTRVKDLGFLLPTFSFLWQRHFVNCVIVFVYKKLEIFAYDAFRNATLNLTECGGCPLFSPHMTNFWGYPLRASTFEEKPLLIKTNKTWFGRDYQIMKGIVNMLNVSLEVTESSQYLLGSVESLTNNESDVCFVSSFLLYKFSKQEIEYSYPDHFNNIVAMVPCGPKMPQYQNLFHIFSSVIWIHLIVMMVFVAFVSRIITRFDKHRKTYFHYLLDVWQSFLQLGIWNFVHTYGRAKPIMTLWFCFCLIFGTAFRTSLISMFIKAKYLKNIDTLSELRDSGMTLYIPEFYAELIPKEYGLHEQFKFVKDMNELHEMVYTSNIVTGYIVNEEAARLYIDIIRNRDNKPMYHIVAEKLMPGLDAYMFQKRSPFINRVNNMLLLLRQFGLRDRWIRHAPVVNEDSRKTNIGILNLQGALCLLILGYIISIVCFIIELLINIKKK